MELSMNSFLKILCVTIFYFIFFQIYADIDKRPLSNFDYIYYCTKHNLGDLNFNDALHHYQTLGYFEKLDYCKSYSLALVLSINSVQQIDEWIDQINYFMKINPQNQYTIFIHITSEAANSINNAKREFPKEPYTYLESYCKNGLEIDSKKIYIYFDEHDSHRNTSFFFMVDKVLKSNINYDYFAYAAVLPNQSVPEASSIFNVPINMLLREYDFITSGTAEYCRNNTKKKNNHGLLNDLLCFLDCDMPVFSYPINSVFIASSKMLTYIGQKNLYRKFKADKINTYKYKIFRNLRLEVAFVLTNYFVGILNEKLRLKTLFLGKNSRDYINDNSMALMRSFGTANSYKMNSNIDTIQHIIKDYNIKVMAIYFPQFHEVEENNILWGKGFTEWTMLRRHKGEIKHPHVDIGYYDMLDYSTRKKQALIAKENGIGAFCYYHYWFKDKKVMYKGIEKILEDGQPDLPFALCWANEPWTKNWDGGNQQVLIAQDYGVEEDWRKHYEYLSQFFKHPLYIKEDNCPIIYIYRIGHILDSGASDMLKLWKRLAKEEGYNGLKIIAIMCAYKNITSLSYDLIDGLAEHQPGYNIMIPGYKMSIQGLDVDVDQKNFYNLILKNEKIGNNYSRGIFYSFDNSSRKHNAQRWKFVNLSYRAFEEFLVKTVLQVAREPNDGVNYILLNSWNEWTEQAMFEPNDHDGYILLNILRKYFGSYIDA
jgi:hypothetical protein